MSAVAAGNYITANERANTYINNMLGSVKGLKVLLLDEEMKNLLSINFTQSELLEHEVVYVGMLGPSNREEMKHLNCIIWCRPTDDSLRCISRELQWGNYGSYGVFFSKMVNDDTLQVLANSDKYHLVERLEEIFLDVTPVAENTCVVPLLPNTFTSGHNVLDNPVISPQWTDEKYRRVCDGLIASMLMMKCRPVIRARTQSEVCERIARELTSRMAVIHSNFPDIRNTDCVLLIMERLDDPMTPLLTQRSYVGMIHDLLGFQDGNKVVLASAADKAALRENDALDENSEEAARARKAKEEAMKHIHVLNPKNDAVFRETAFIRYDEFPITLSKWFNEAKKNLGVTKDKINRESMSPKELAALNLKLEPITRNVERHEEIFEAIKKEVKTRNLGMLTGIEQSFFELDDVLVFSQEVREMVSSADYELDDALRLTLLYHLRYEQSSQKITDELKDILRRRGLSNDKIAAIDNITSVAGAQFRLHNLWKDGLKKAGEDVTKAMWAGLKAIGTLNGVIGGNNNNNSNAPAPGAIQQYHQPLMRTLVNRLFNGRLSEVLYPVHHASGHSAGEAAAMRPKEIMIFVPGGVSYEEVQLVHSINEGKIENRVEGVTTGNYGKARYDIGKIGAPQRYNMGSATASSAATGGGGGAGSMSHPESSHITSKVSLFSTGLISSGQFLKSFEK